MGSGKSNGETCRKAIVAALSLLIVSSGAFLFFGSGTTSAADAMVDDAVDVPTPAADISLFNRFIANEGQWPSSVEFVAATNFGSAAFASDGFYYYLSAPENITVIAGETADLGALSMRSVLSGGTLVAAVVVAAALVVVAFLLVRKRL